MDLSNLPEGLDPLLCDIHTAILNDDIAKLQELCEAGGYMKMNERFTPEINPQHAGMTPLALSAALNKVHILGVLLDYGADVNLPFATLNTTALMTSSFHGHVEVVRMLLQRGADVRMVDLQQSTALGYVFGGSRNMDVIKLLFEAGVDVNQKNMLGMNALLLVSGYGDDRLVYMTLQAGADPNATNDFGHSALHLAVVGKRDQIKKMKRMGSKEAAEADRSLNRRNLDQALQDWARQHPDLVGGQPKMEALAEVGQFMMSLGQKLEETDLTEDDDQEAMKKRVEAVFKHRQEKLKENKEKKKPAIMNLLSCGGGKSGKTPKKTGAQPYSPSNSSGELNKPRGNDEVSQLSERCAHILHMLIEAGCHINKTEKTFGMTALDMAILNGDIESTAILVCAGGDGSHLMKMFAMSDLYEPLVMASRKDVKEILMYDEDLDVNQSFSRFNITRKSGDQAQQEEVGDEGMTPTAVAVRTDDGEIVKMFLKEGADLNNPGLAGRTPLAEAAGRGNVRMMDFLMAKGANVEAVNPAFDDGTAVVVATIMRQPRSLEALIRRGAKVDTPQRDGRTSLVRAMEARDSQLVDLLLMADLQRNFDERNAFMYQMAEKYQSKDRDVESILNEAADHARQFKERDERMEAERAAAAAAARQPHVVAAPPRRQPSPVQAAPAPIIHRALPPEQPVQIQPTQAAPPPQIIQQAAPPPQQEEESSEEEDEFEDADGAQQAPPPAPRAPAPQIEVQQVQPQVQVRRDPPPPQVTTQVVTMTTVQTTQEDIPPEPTHAPPPLPANQPPPPPASGPPESESEEEEEESSEEEETSEEESSEEEEEEEEPAPQPQRPQGQPQMQVQQIQMQQGQPQVTRTVVTRTMVQGQPVEHQQVSETVTQRTVVTKQTIVSGGQTQVITRTTTQQEEEEEEDTDSEEEETDSEEEETDSEEEETDEEEEEGQDINENVNKGHMTQNKAQASSVETEI